MRHGPPARDGIPSVHSDGEVLPEVACLSCVTSNDRDTPAELGDKLIMNCNHRIVNTNFFYYISANVIDNKLNTRMPQ